MRRVLKAWEGQEVQAKTLFCTMTRPTTPVDQKITAPTSPPIEEPTSRPVLRVVGNGAPFVANAQAHQAFFSRVLLSLASDD